MGETGSGGVRESITKPVSISRSGNESLELQGINIEVLEAHEEAAHPAVGGTTYENPMQNQVHIPDQHVMLIYGWWHGLSDLSGELVDKFSEAWIYNDHVDPADNWDSRTAPDSFVAYSHLGEGQAADAAHTGPTEFSKIYEYPLPLMNPDGKITIEHEGLPEDNAEWFISVLYDIEPIHDAQEYLELLMKR